jgi:hypothetical protein
VFVWVIGSVVDGCVCGCWFTIRYEYVILIAFPRQQWLPERAYMLCDTQFASLVCVARGTMCDHVGGNTCITKLYEDTSVLGCA